MTNVVVGYLAAFITIIGWGSQVVPMKRVKNYYDPVWYQIIVCFVVFTSGLLLSFFTHSFVFTFLGVISGSLWVFASLFVIMSLRHADVSVAFPVWAGISIVISFLWGLFFFGEKMHDPLLGIIGIVLLLIGIIFVSSIGKKSGSTRSAGIIYAIIAGIILGSYFVPIKIGNISPIATLFPMSVGILIGGLLLLVFRQPTFEARIILPAFASGMMWNVANFASFFVIANLGLAIGYPLTQTCLLVSVLWGFFYFHEMKQRHAMVKLFLAASILFLGSIVLTSAK